MKIFSFGRAKRNQEKLQLFEGENKHVEQLESAQGQEGEE